MTTLSKSFLCRNQCDAGIMMGSPSPPQLPKRNLRRACSPKPTRWSFSTKHLMSFYSRFSFMIRQMQRSSCWMASPAFINQVWTSSSMWYCFDVLNFQWKNNIWTFSTNRFWNHVSQLGSGQENELLLMSVLDCLFNAVTQILRKNVDKKALFDNFEVRENCL